MHYNYLYTLSSQYVCLQLLGHNGPFVGFYLKARPALRDKKFTAIFIQQSFKNYRTSLNDNKKADDTLKHHNASLSINVSVASACI